MKPKPTSILNIIFGSLLSSMSINLFQYLNIAAFLLVSQDDQPISPSIAAKGAYLCTPRKYKLHYVGMASICSNCLKSQTSLQYSKIGQFYVHIVA